MKTIMIIATLAFSMFASANTLQQAQELYAKRAYNAAGIQQVKAANAIYRDLVREAGGEKANLELTYGLIETLYFLGEAVATEDEQKAMFWEGYQIADRVVVSYGVTDIGSIDDRSQRDRLQQTVNRLKALPEPEKTQFARILYVRSSCLGQWGQLNGVRESLGRKDELINNGKLVINMGKKDVNEHGPMRALGRTYYVLPALFGGSNRKAKQYLKEAFVNTRNGGRVSINGYTNLYYAEVLEATGEEAKAKKLLKLFIDSDMNTLNPTSIPENKRAHKKAVDLLAEWNR